MSKVRILFLNIVCALLLLPQFSFAQIVRIATNTVAEDTHSEVSEDMRSEENVTKLVIDGDYALALQELEKNPRLSQSAEGIKLRAEFLIRLKRYDEASSLLERYISNNPTDGTARFQLGEIYFQLKQDKAALQSYRLANSAKLDDLRIKMINKRLFDIKMRRPVQSYFRFSLGPDTNFNQASNLDTIEMYGIPFILNQDAKSQKGIVVRIAGGVRLKKPINESISLFDTFDFYGVNAPKTFADNSAVINDIGLIFYKSEKSSFQISYSAGFSTLANRSLEHTNGISIGSQYYFANQSLDMELEYKNIESTNFPDRVGDSIAINIENSKYFDPSHMLSVSGGAYWRTMADPSQNFASYYLGIGYFHPLFRGLTLSEMLTRTQRLSPNMETAFLKNREDNGVSAKLKLSKQDVKLLGAKPYVSYEYEKNKSNIPLYSVTGSRVNFGFDKEF